MPLVRLLRDKLTGLYWGQDGWVAQQAKAQAFPDGRALARLVLQRHISEPELVLVDRDGVSHYELRVELNPPLPPRPDEPETGLDPAILKATETLHRLYRQKEKLQELERRVDGLQRAARRHRRRETKKP